MTYREKLNWIGLIAGILGIAYYGALFVTGRAGLGGSWASLFLIAFVILGWQGLRAASRRSDADDERDLLIRAKALGLTAQVMFFGVIAALAFSNGGALGVVPKQVLWIVLLAACAAGSGRSLYLYRNSV